MEPEKLHELVTYCREFANTMLSDSSDFILLVRPWGPTIRCKLWELTMGQKTLIPANFIYY